MAEPNTVETNNEPTLDQFNESSATPAADQSATADAANATQPTGTEPAGQQPAAKAAESGAAAEAQPTAEEDPYAKVLDGVQVPQGLEINAQLLTGLKGVAKQFNMSADAVKALVQLDLNNLQAQSIAEGKILQDAQAKWQQENQAKYGDNLKNVETNCSRVLAELDKEGKFKELLATVGAEKHPATLGFLKTIGDLYLEKPSVNPNATVSTDEEVELENFN